MDRTPEEDQEFIRKVHGKLIELQLALEADAKSARTCRFWGYYFPQDFDLFVKAEIDGHIECRHAHFAGDADFTEAQIKGAVDFDHAVIAGNLDFSRARIGGRADFKHVHVGGDASFHSAEVGFEIGRGGIDLTSALIDGKVDFEAARISGRLQGESALIGKDAVFDDAVVEGTLTLIRGKIGGSACFIHAEIEGDLSLWGVPIAGEFHAPRRIGGSLYLSHATIGANTVFTLSDVMGTAEFIETKFGGDATFRVARFVKPVSFEKAEFLGRVNMEGISLPDSGSFVGMRVSKGRGDQIYRVAKQMCQRAGNYKEAGDWHYKERCDAWYSRVFLDRRKPLEKVTAFVKPSNLLDLLMGRLTLGYGERWWHVLIAGGITILVFTLFYHLARAQATDNCLGQSLLLSVAAFVRYGFSNFQLRAGNFMHYVVASEVVVGTALISLLLVVMVKRWGRG